MCHVQIRARKNLGFFPRKLFRIIFDLKVKVWPVINKRLVEVLIMLQAYC